MEKPKKAVAAGHVCLDITPYFRAEYGIKQRISCFRGN